MAYMVETHLRLRAMVDQIPDDFLAFRNFLPTLTKQATSVCCNKQGFFAVGSLLHQLVVRRWFRDAFFFTDDGIMFC